MSGGHSFHLDDFGVGLTQGQLVAPHGQLQRVAQRGNLAHADLHALGDAHVHDAALERALTMQLDHAAGSADLDIS